MTIWTPAQTELLRRVGEEARDTNGWQVTPRDDGFDLRRDLTAETRDAETGASPERTRARTITHEVRFEEDGSYVVTDVDSRAFVDLRGTDRGPQRSVERGTKVGGGFAMTFKFVDGRLRRIDDNRYDLAAGRKLVERLARESGIEQYRAKMGWEAKVGAFFAILAAVGLLVGGVVLGVLALTGNLPEG